MHGSLMAETDEQHQTTSCDPSTAATHSAGMNSVRQGPGGLSDAEASRRLSPSSGLLLPPTPRAVAWTGGHASLVDEAAVCDQEGVKIPDCAEEANVIDGTEAQRAALVPAIEHGRQVATAAVNHLFSDDIYGSNAFRKWFGGPAGELAPSDDSDRTARSVASAATRRLIVQCLWKSTRGRAFGDSMLSLT
jgi:hypothetical protein